MSEHNSDPKASEGRGKERERKKKRKARKKAPGGPLSKARLYILEQMRLEPLVQNLGEGSPSDTCT